MERDVYLRSMVRVVRNAICEGRASAVNDSPFGLTGLHDTYVNGHETAIRVEDYSLKLGLAGYLGNAPRGPDRGFGSSLNRTLLRPKGPRNPHG